MDRDKINRMFAVPHTFIADEARQAGAADSCQLPAATTSSQWSMLNMELYCSCHSDDVSVFNVTGIVVYLPPPSSQIRFHGCSMAFHHL